MRKNWWGRYAHTGRARTILSRNARMKVGYVSRLAVLPSPFLLHLRSSPFLCFFLSFSPMDAEKWLGPIRAHGESKNDTFAKRADEGRWRLSLCIRSLPLLSLVFSLPLLSYVFSLPLFSFVSRCPPFLRFSPFLSFLVSPSFPCTLGKLVGQIRANGESKNDTYAFARG